MASLMKNSGVSNRMTDALAGLEINPIFVFRAMRTGKHQPVTFPMAFAGVKFSFFRIQFKANLHGYFDFLNNRKR